MSPDYLIISARVRYWEDATVNGVEDADGSLIPLRFGDEWEPEIHIDSGVIKGWPEGVEANIHYKVCDAGTYWLEDHEGVRRWKYQGDYVPDILSPSGEGYGDYIIMKVFSDGSIEKWDRKALNISDWEGGPNE